MERQKVELIKFEILSKTEKFVVYSVGAIVTVFLAFFDTSHPIFMNLAFGCISFFIGWVFLSQIIPWSLGLYQYARVKKEVDALYSELDKLEKTSNDL